MNGKKAKLLRRLTGPTSPTEYKAINVEGKYMNSYVDAKGNPVLDGEGRKTFNRLQWTTHTAVIVSGTRMISNVLKNIYYNRTRGLHKNIRKADMATA